MTTMTKTIQMTILFIRENPEQQWLRENQVDTVSAVKANQLPSSPISKPVYTKFSNHTEKVSKDNIKDTSDSFKMFWFDYAEAENSLLLFGKIMTKEGKLVSGVVKVDGICRGFSTKRVSYCG